MSTEHIIHLNDFFYEYEINHFRVKLNKNYYKIHLICFSFLFFLHYW